VLGRVLSPLPHARWMRLLQTNVPAYGGERTWIVSNPLYLRAG
jgi:hypothetical protein